MKEIYKAKYRESFHALSGNTTVQNLYILSNLESLQIPSFWDFMETSLHRYDWLNHSPLVIDSTSSLSLLLEGQRWELGAESFNTLITWLLFQATSSHPQVGSKSLLIKLMKDTFMAPITGNSRDLESCELVTVDEDKYV